MQNVLTKISDVSIKPDTNDKELLIRELKKFITGKLKENNDNIKVIGEIFRENTSKHYPVKKGKVLL